MVTETSEREQVNKRVVAANLLCFTQALFLKGQEYSLFSSNICFSHVPLVYILCSSHPITRDHPLSITWTFLSYLGRQSASLEHLGALVSGLIERLRDSIHVAAVPQLSGMNSVL